MSSQNSSHLESLQKDYSEKLKPITQLFKESWGIYRLKIKILLGIIGLPIGFSFFFWILIHFLAGTPIRYSIWFSVVNAIFYLGSLFLLLWAIPSLLYNLKENTSIKESYKRGFKISYIWVYFLLTIIIAGGFLLFVIPGILFSIWFSLAIFVLVFEETKGFNALFKSKHLIKGRFWGVLGRFLVLGLTTGLGLFLIFALIIFVIENRQIERQVIEVMSYFIQLFVLPFFLIYGFLIYNNVKEIKAEIPYKEPSLNRKIKYVIPGILGTLIVGLVVSLSFLNIFLGRDEPPIDDSDLWLSKIEIPKEENAFYPLIQAIEKVYQYPPEKIELFYKMLRGEKWNSEFAEELIKKNEEVFRYFERAMELPYFQIPEWQDPETVEIEIALPYLARLRGIARLNSFKTNYLLRQGKEKEALDLSVKTIKMGQMMQDSPRHTPISYLVGTAIKEIGLHRLRMMIPNLTLSSEILKEYVAKLEQFKANEEGLIRAMKMEYTMFTNFLPLEKLGTLEVFGIRSGIMEETSFEIIRKAVTKLNYLCKPNQTQRIFAEYWRNFIDDVNKDYYEMKLLEIEPLAPPSKIKMLFTENLVGKVLRDIMVPDFPHLLRNKCLGDLSVIGTQALLAIRAYQLETGKIPSSLDELVPEYFSKVPRDPFDGKPIRYSPEKRIIYSVGEDLKDSGGGEHQWEKKEPTFRIEF